MDNKLRTSSFAVAVVIAAALGIAGCSGAKSRVHGGRVDQVLDQKPTKGPYFIAIGIGGSDPTLTSETQRKALARDAAIVKAQYEMLSMVRGVELSGGIKVSRALESDSMLETRIKEVIRGAEVVKSEFTSDNGCVVTLRLPKNRIADVLQDRLE